MKIFDCFMFYDEKILLDIRLNILSEYVDYFVIVESKFTHSGEERDLQFNPKKFEKFKDKIIYLIYDQQPLGIESFDDRDTDHETSSKYIFNAGHRENGQRNHIQKGLVNAEAEDIILISDVDEIPNLSKINFNKINQKIFLFKQNMFYYKFNLHMPNLKWTGTKGCKKKDLINPQWLRNIKDRKYSAFRLDTFFSDKKYSSVKIIEDGGWHFSNIKTAADIEHKLKSYLHHVEYDENPGLRRRPGALSSTRPPRRTPAARSPGSRRSRAAQRACPRCAATAAVSSGGTRRASRASRARPTSARASRCAAASTASRRRSSCGAACTSRTRGPRRRPARSAQQCHCLWSIVAMGNPLSLGAGCRAAIRGAVQCVRMNLWMTSSPSLIVKHNGKP